MEKYFRRLNYLWILLAMPLAASTSLIYVTNSAGTTVQVIDPVTNKVVQVIENIERAEAVQFSPDGSRVYIGNRSENLFVVDRKTGKLIKKVPLSGFANDLAVTKDGKRVLVCINEQTPGALDIIDTTSLEKVKSIPTKSGLHDIVVTADGKYAISGGGGKTLIVFDLQSEQVAWDLPLGGNIAPMAIENGPAGSARRLFVQVGEEGFVVVDFAKRQEVARIHFPDQPPSPATHSGTVSHGIGVAPDGKTVWVNSKTFNSVFVYSVPELKLLGSVPLPEIKLPGKAPIGAGPNWITFTHDSRGVYITGRSSHSVTAIDAKTMKVVAVIPVGEAPDRISTLVLP